MNLASEKLQKAVERGDFAESSKDRLALNLAHDLRTLTSVLGYLDFIRIEKEPIDLSELLVQINEELYPVFEKNQLTARLNLTPHLNIRGDGELLARVFENLFDECCSLWKGRPVCRYQLQSRFRSCGSSSDQLWRSYSPGGVASYL